MKKPEKNPAKIGRSWFLVLFLAFPYNVLEPVYSALFLNLSAIAFLVMNLRWRTAPPMLWLVVFSMFVALRSVLALLDPDYSWAVVASQANHFWQYLIFVWALLVSFTGPVDLKELINARRFQMLLGATTMLTFIFSYMRFGYVHEFSVNSLMLLFCLFFARTTSGTQLVIRFILIAAFITIFWAADRASPLLVIAAIALSAWVPMRPSAAKVIALTIIALPIFIYLLVDRNDLAELISVDHNTYIRAEFIRAAWENLRSHLTLGVGFGPSFRPYNFDYLTTHRLLTEIASLDTVSNHHSIFDTTYRLGLPVAALLTVSIFLMPKLPNNDRLALGALFVLALGLSLNAWFENQSQLPMVAVLSCILLAADGNLRARVVKQAGKRLAARQRGGTTTS